MKNNRNRSMVLGLAACGLLTWWPAAQAQGLGAAVGAGMAGGARAGGSLLSGPGADIRGDARVEAQGSLHADSDSMGSRVRQGQRDAIEDTRAARNRAAAATRQASEFGQSTATAARETSGRAVAAAATEADGRAAAAVQAAGTGVAGTTGRIDAVADVAAAERARGTKAGTGAPERSAHDDGAGAKATDAEREAPARGARAEADAQAATSASGSAQADESH